MRTVLLFLALLFSSADASNELQPTYKFTDHAVTGKTLFPGIQKDFLLLNIPSDKTRYRVPVSTVTDAFKQHNIPVNPDKLRYITFIKKSPVDLQPLEKAVRNFYVDNFPSIIIKQITVTPRVYTKSLPQDYEVALSPKSTRLSEGTFYIRTGENRKFFFEYTIDALIGVVHAKYDLKRKTELTPFNTATLNVKLDALRGEPLTGIQPHQYRLKQSVKAHTPLSRREIESSPMVKRGKQLLVSMKNGAVLIEFSAIALEDGALYDIIAIRKADGQRIKAKVTGLNRVEIQ